MSDDRYHLPALDVLRGVAIGAVFAFHLLGAAYGADALPWSGLWADFGRPPSRTFYALLPLTAGWAGVAIFFALSGFLIHLSYLRNGTLDVSAFYRRRFWRIVPPYLLVLAALVAWHWPGWRQVAAHASLAHNARPYFFFEINPSFWSLAVEVQFYLIYPLFLFVRNRAGIGGAMAFSLAVAIACRAWAADTEHWLADPGEAFGYRWRNTPHLWIDWCAGAWAAERFQGGRTVRGAGRWSAVLFVACLASAFFKPTYYALSFTLASVGAALLILWFVAKPRRHTKWLARLGLCSYSFYLIHQPIVGAIGAPLRSVGTHPAMLMAGGVLLAFPALFGLSWLMYRWVEVPSARMSKRRRSAVVESQAAP